MQISPSFDSLGFGAEWITLACCEFLLQIRAPQVMDSQTDQRGGQRKECRRGVHFNATGNGSGPGTVHAEPKRCQKRHTLECAFALPTAYSNNQAVCRFLDPSMLATPSPSSANVPGSGTWPVGGGSTGGGLIELPKPSR